MLAALLTSLALLTPQAGRTYTAGRFALEIDGISAGWAVDMAGGYQTQAVTNSPGQGGVFKKHVAGVKYEDISIACGTGMTARFYEWVKASFDHKASRKNGAIIAADYNYKEHARMLFTGGLFNELDFPALDAASKDAAKMSIKFHPEYTTLVSTQASPPAQSGSSEGWSASNFSVTMPRFPTVTVLKVSRVKVHFYWDRQLSFHNPTDTDLVSFTIPPSDAPAFEAWYQASISGKSSAHANETLSVIDYVNTDGTLKLTLNGLGIVSLHPELDDLLHPTGNFVAEMYVQDTQFSFAPNKSAGGS